MGKEHKYEISCLNAEFGAKLTVTGGRIIAVLATVLDVDGKDAMKVLIEADD